MKALLVAGLAVAVSGCSASGSAVETSHGVINDGILIVASTSGMKAFSDMQNGIINNAMSDHAQKSSYYQQREEQEKQESFREQIRETEKTKRELAPGFVGRLFGK